MSESARSLTFVVAALAMAGVAWFVRPPDNLTPEEMRSAKLNTPFFPDFKDPNAPTSIRVVGFNEEQAVSRIFAVELKDGLWRIPSHNNYPADGADRLAKTATSLLGVVREEVMPGGETQHEVFGVVDPLETDSTKLKGRGQRVTLTKETDVLLDLIIGKPVRERPGHRYLRRPDEKSVYVAKISPDLSTKFSDWVETNLLKLSRDELSSVEIDNYSIEEGNDGLARIVPGDVVRLSHEKSFDPWKLDGLDDPEKEVDSTKTNEMVNSLVDLKLIGVRPKPPGLNADLTIDRKIVKQKAQLTMLVNEMSAKGFVPGPGKTEDEPDRLYSKLGEIRLTSNKGLAYTLRFGDVFNGSEAEIESGVADKQESKEGEQPKSDEPKSSRYLLVSVAFDQSLLGPQPEKPEPPADLDAEPARPEAASAPEKSTSAPADGDSPKGDNQGNCGQEAGQPAGDPQTPPAEQPAAPAQANPAGPDAAQPPAGEPAAVQPDPAANKARLKQQYEAQLTKYEADLKDWESKAKTGKERAEELNRRFSTWYYVISADVIQKMRLTRDQLIKAKSAPGGADAAAGGLPPGLGLPGGLPGGLPLGQPASRNAGVPDPANEVPDDETSPPDQAPTEATPTEPSPEAAPKSEGPAPEQNPAPREEQPAPAGEPGGDASDNLQPDPPDLPENS
jgi:hypothetical protein